MNFTKYVVCVFQKPHLTGLKVHKSITQFTVFKISVPYVSCTEVRENLAITTSLKLDVASV
jgi:hypothetical protein